MQINRQDTLEIARAKLLRDEHALMHNKNEVSARVSRANKKLQYSKKVYKQVQAELIGAKDKARPQRSPGELKRGHEFLGQQVKKLKGQRNVLAELIAKLQKASQALEKSKLQQEIVSKQALKLKLRQSARAEQGQIEDSGVSKFLERTKDAEGIARLKPYEDTEFLSDPFLDQLPEIPSAAMKIEEQTSSMQAGGAQEFSLSSGAYSDLSSHSGERQEPFDVKEDFGSISSSSYQEVSSGQGQSGLSDLQTWKTDNAQGISLNYQTSSGRSLKLLLQKNSDSSIQVHIVQLNRNKGRGISTAERMEIRTALEDSGLEVRSLYFEESHRGVK